jgi:hypothetical protein
MTFNGFIIGILVKIGFSSNNKESLNRAAKGLI